MTSPSESTVTEEAEDDAIFEDCYVDLGADLPPLHADKWRPIEATVVRSAAGRWGSDAK